MRPNGLEKGGDSYATKARLLSLAIAGTGALTAAYLALASHVLTPVETKRLDLVWSVLFVAISVVHRPVEQLLSRSIADRRARAERVALRGPLLIQAVFTAGLVGAALALHGPVRRSLTGGSETLYEILLAAAVLYACSYAARGWIAGHQRFGLYGAVAILEAGVRVLFVLAAVVGVTHGERAVALGLVAGPLATLAVVPLAARRRQRRQASAAAAPPALPDRLRDSGAFAVSVAAIMLGEQALLNGGVLAVDATASNPALAGIAFNILLVARAPLQLFGAVQTSLLPHLTALHARGDLAAFDDVVRRILARVLLFSAVVSAALLVAGPPVMRVAFGQPFSYPRGGLVLVGLGMGCHLAAATVNQAALARGRAALAGAVWLTAAAAFVGWTAAPILRDPLLRMETGYAGAAAALLCCLLAVVLSDRRGAASVSRPAAAA